jgi:hypothetical protein
MITLHWMDMRCSKQDDPNPENWRKKNITSPQVILMFSHHVFQPKPVLFKFPHTWESPAEGLRRSEPGAEIFAFLTNSKGRSVLLFQGSPFEQQGSESRSKTLMTPYQEFAKHGPPTQNSLGTLEDFVGWTRKCIPFGGMGFLEQM